MRRRSPPDPESTYPPPPPPPTAAPAPPSTSQRVASNGHPQSPATIENVATTSPPSAPPVTSLLESSPSKEKAPPKPIVIRPPIPPQHVYAPMPTLGALSFLGRKKGKKEMEDYTLITNADPEGPGICAMFLTLVSFLLVLVTLPFSLCVTVKVVQEYERAVVFRLGRLRSGGAKGPGLFFVMPCVDSYKKVDLRTVSFDVPPQEVLSRDSVTVSVDAVVYYRVSNPTMATNNIEDYSHSTRLLAATTLRNVLGTKNLAEILSERETISQVMQNALDEATDPWGVKAERVEIKDVRLPVQLQRAMAAEAEAAREARAKVIAAEGEQKASRALREAANVIAESSSALQLRYLQTLSSIAAEHNSTIIFPMPMNILDHFMDKSGGESSPPRSQIPKELEDKSE